MPNFLAAHIPVPQEATFSTTSASTRTRASRHGISVEVRNNQPYLKLLLLSLGVNRKEKECSLEHSDERGESMRRPHVSGDDRSSVGLKATLAPVGVLVGRRVTVHEVRDRTTLPAAASRHAVTLGAWLKRNSSLIKYCARVLLSNSVYYTYITPRTNLGAAFAYGKRQERKTRG